MKALLTPAQAAAMLAISTRQLHDLASTGAIAYVDIGIRPRPTRRYHPDDVEAFVQSRTRVAGGRPASPHTKALHLRSSAADFVVRLKARQEKWVRENEGSPSRRRKPRATKD